MKLQSTVGLSKPGASARGFAFRAPVFVTGPPSERAIHDPRRLWLLLEFAERSDAPSVGGARPKVVAADAIHCPILACRPGCGPSGSRSNCPISRFRGCRVSGAFTTVPRSQHDQGHPNTRCSSAVLPLYGQQLLRDLARGAMPHHLRPIQNGPRRYARDVVDCSIRVDRRRARRCARSRSEVLASGERPFAGQDALT